MTSSTQAAFMTTITVEVPLERAFTVFTAGFDTWWPREHHIGEQEMAEAVIEGRMGGRWLERSVDGSECEWGRVLVWDPPNRVTLSWHLNADFQCDPDPGYASRVDVRFFADGEHSTRVEFEHGDLDRHGVDWPKLLTGVSGDGGWSGLLKRFALAAIG
jgi:uncharacterized protein YndB with AHSA1/START domain